MQDFIQMKCTLPWVIKYQDLPGFRCGFLVQEEYFSKDVFNYFNSVHLTRENRLNRLQQTLMLKDSDAEKKRNIRPHSLIPTAPWWSRKSEMDVTRCWTGHWRHKVEPGWVSTTKSRVDNRNSPEETLSSPCNDEIKLVSEFPFHFHHQTNQRITGRLKKKSSFGAIL